MTLGLLPVVPITLVSAALVVVVSKLTPSARPAAATLARYFAPAAGTPSPAARASRTPS
jgi:hypothetical protein